MGNNEPGVTGDDGIRDLWHDVFGNQDGVPADTLAAVKMHKMEELQEQAPENYEDHISPNDIYARVMGCERHGRVRCCGMSVTPAQLWGSSSGSLRASSRNSKVGKLQEEVTSMKDELETIRNELAFMKKMFEQYFSRQDARINLESESPMDQQQISMD